MAILAAEADTAADRMTAGANLTSRVVTTTNSHLHLLSRESIQTKAALLLSLLPCPDGCYLSFFFPVDDTNDVGDLALAFLESCMEEQLEGKGWHFRL